MTDEERNTLWLDAQKKFFDVTQPNWLMSGGNSLDELLGVKEYEKWLRNFRDDHKPMPEDLRRMLVMLNGPHGQTILKAHLIKRGLEP